MNAASASEAATATTPCSARCLLRPAAETDLAAIEAALRHPAFPYRLPLAQMQRDGKLAAWLARNTQFPNSARQLPPLWSIDLPQQASCIGQIGLIARPAQHDHALSFWLHPDYWGQALALEALQTLLHHARNHYQLGNLWAATAVWNHSSAKLLQRLGFQPPATPYNGPGYLIDGEEQPLLAFVLESPTPPATC